MLRVQRPVFPASLSRFSSMTRATLLQLLAHPTALNGADVRALEQLATAFPYCQSAHLLLAKAAHDQGSMLAGQRLRRAATYAADRSLLRQLIELPEPAEVQAALAAVQADNLLGTALPPAPLVAGDDANSELEESPLSLAAQSVAIIVDQPGQVIGTPEAGALAQEPALAKAAPAQEPAEEELLAPVAAAEELPTQAPVDVNEELPAQAPPIRPPAEAVAAHQEFGLALEEPADIIAYRLPELAEPLALPIGVEEAVAVTPLLPAFSGLAGVSYAPEEGSRLGFCLVAADLADVLPAASLPPAGEFFAPDAGVLAHLAAHQPAAPKAKSLDLINSFLQRAPAPTRRRAAPLANAPEPDAQADLSVRSTRAEPDLASESLAKILARQGKTDRAIAVYERLMVKQPEKTAYFAAQIESLRSLT
jgi:hypothetical protein